MVTSGYLVSRGWRDTPQGIELSLWLATVDGPLHVQIDAQESVCFIERSVPVTLPASARRKPLELSLLHGDAVDALYFRRHRDLQQLRQTDTPLCESDIKPVDRFLMERFIHAGMEVHGDISMHKNVRQVRNPKLVPVTLEPTLKAVAIDIETRANTRELYSIAGALLGDNTGHGHDALRAEDYAHAVVFMRGEANDERRDGYTLHYCDSEEAVIKAFLNWMKLIDPDIITGWAVINFDLNFLDQKCKDLNIPFALGRAGATAAVLQPGNPGSPRIARVPGRAVLDGIDQLKAGFWAFDSFSLDNVAHELLGVGKLISTDSDKVAEINRRFRDNKPELADYNLRDCTLVNDIFIKADLIAFAVQRANLTGLALDRLGGSVAAFDNLYLPKLHREGFVAPDVSARDDGGSPGGFVMDSIPGLYRDVLVLDFKSLYPSIIRTFFVDPLGLAVPGDDPVPGFVEANFSRHQHILPGLIEELWHARDAAKRTSNAPLSQAIKIIMNSFYGVLGTTGCRFHDQRLASSITRRGHQIINDSRDFIEDAGYKVIYGDTDSLFVHIDATQSATACHRIGDELMNSLNDWWKKRLRKEFDLESHLEVEFETHFQRFLMPTVRGMATGSKKRYAGLVTGKDESPELMIKGLEAVRTDWTPLARDFQRELLRRVFTDQPFEDYVRTTAEQLSNGELDGKLIYRKRLRRPLSDYQRNVPPHVQAARKLPRAGSWIRYVITRNGPEPVDALESAPDYQHYLDKQLAPAADGILHFMDTSFGTLTDAQMDMF